MEIQSSILRTFSLWNILVDFHVQRYSANVYGYNIEYIAKNLIAYRYFWYLIIYKLQNTNGTMYFNILLLYSWFGDNKYLLLFHGWSVKRYSGAWKTLGNGVLVRCSYSIRLIWHRPHCFFWVTATDLWLYNHCIGVMCAFEPT